MIVVFPVDGTRFREWRETLDSRTSKWTYWDDEKSLPFDEKGKELTTDMLTRTIRSSLMAGVDKVYNIKVNIPVFEEGWAMRHLWTGAKVVG
jgi:hypothetical protein